MSHNFETKETKTPVKIPTTLIPCRVGDHLLILIPNYWGKGPTIEEAKAQISPSHLKGVRATKVWRVYSVHPETSVNGMGGLNYKKAHPPLMIASTIWPIP